MAKNSEVYKTAQGEPIKCPANAIPKGTVFEMPDGSIFRLTRDAYLIERKAIESVAVNKMRFPRMKKAKDIKESEEAK